MMASTFGYGVFNSYSETILNKIFMQSMDSDLYDRTLKENKSNRSQV